MKKTVMAMAALLVMSSVQQLDAQQRRTTSTRNRTSTRTTGTQTKQAAPAFVKEVAFYQLDYSVQAITATQDYLYYIEEGDNNAVKRIDRKTGEVETFINGQAGVYEGRRSYLRDIEFGGGKTILVYGPYDFEKNVGILLDGGKIKKYKDYWTNLHAFNGKYALIGDYRIDCIDLEKMEYVFQSLEGNLSAKYFIQPNGDIWWCGFDYDELGVKYRTKEGKHGDYSLANESYVANEGVHQILQMRSNDKYVFLACQRRIYAMDTTNPGRWIEYAKVPPTMDYQFTDFWVNGRGDILAYNGMTMKGRVQLFRAGNADNPQALGRGMAIDKGINQTGYNEISLFQTQVISDADNNWIIVNGRSIRIYNPDGVVGYEKARGKIVKI